MTDISHLRNRLTAAPIRPKTGGRLLYHCAVAFHPTKITEWTAHKDAAWNDYLK